VKNDLGYHVDVVLFADAQMLRKVFIAFESLPELENISCKWRNVRKEYILVQKFKKKI
jgi:hypothetical protein